MPETASDLFRRGMRGVVEAAGLTADPAAPAVGESPSLREREAEYERFVSANLRRNYTANFIHGMLGLTGFRLIYAPTFIPAYIHRLTGDDALVGLGTSLLQFGAILSPLLSASFIDAQTKILP